MPPNASRRVLDLSMSKRRRVAFEATTAAVDAMSKAARRSAFRTRGVGASKSAEASRSREVHSWRPGMVQPPKALSQSNIIPTSVLCYQNILSHKSKNAKLDVSCLITAPYCPHPARVLKDLRERGHVLTDAQCALLLDEALRRYHAALAGPQQHELLSKAELDDAINSNFYVVTDDETGDVVEMNRSSKRIFETPQSVQQRLAQEYKCVYALRNEILAHLEENQSQQHRRTLVRALRLFSAFGDTQSCVVIMQYLRMQWSREQQQQQQQQSEEQKKDNFVTVEDLANAHGFVLNACSHGIHASTRCVGVTGGSMYPLARQHYDVLMKDLSANADRDDHNRYDRSERAQRHMTRLLWTVQTSLEVEEVYSTLTTIPTSAISYHMVIAFFEACALTPDPTESSKTMATTLFKQLQDLEAENSGARNITRSPAVLEGLVSVCASVGRDVETLFTLRHALRFMSKSSATNAYGAYVWALIMKRDLTGAVRAVRTMLMNRAPITAHTMQILLHAVYTQPSSPAITYHTALIIFNMCEKNRVVLDAVATAMLLECLSPDLEAVYKVLVRLRERTRSAEARSRAKGKRLRESGHTAAMLAGVVYSVLLRSHAVANATISEAEDKDVVAITAKLRARLADFVMDSVANEMHIDFTTTTTGQLELLPPPPSDPSDLPDWVMSWSTSDDAAEPRWAVPFSTTMKVFHWCQTGRVAPDVADIALRELRGLSARRQAVFLAINDNDDVDLSVLNAFNTAPAHSPFARNRTLYEKYRLALRHSELASAAASRDGLIDRVDSGSAHATGFVRPGEPTGSLPPQEDEEMGQEAGTLLELTIEDDDNVDRLTRLDSSYSDDGADLVLVSDGDDSEADFGQDVDDPTIDILEWDFDEQKKSI
eukprot:PhM_4_TR8475/c0_g1_i1/m.104016